MRERDAVHLDHEFGGGQQCVFSQLHRRGAGMGFHALHHHVVPALAQRALDHADDAFVGFEHRPLFDVRLEVGADRRRRRRGGHGAGIADG
ncbi:hypothetical protein FQZ97_939740 [compost metagenome]